LFTVRRIAALAVVVMLAVAAPMSASAFGAAQHAKAKKHVKPTFATFGAAPANRKGPDGLSYFTFDTTPGGRLTSYVAVINYTGRPVKLAVYPVDAVPATNGTMSFPSNTAPRTAAGAWLAIGTPNGNGEITVKPRATDVLPVRIIVPPNAPPGDHVGAVIVSLAGLVTGKFGSGSAQKVTFDQRIAVKAVFRVAGPVHPLVEIQDLKASYSGPIDPFARGDVKVTYVVHNGGNVVFGGPQTVSVHGLFGENVAGPAITAIPPLLPGASYPVTVRIPKVYPELLMSAKVTVSPQGLQGDVDPGLGPVSSSVHFLAIPWILLVVLLLLILGLCYRYWRRRRRRPAEPQSVVTEPQGATA
jgi:WxL interacting protein linking bacterial and host surfaces